MLIKIHKIPIAVRPIAANVGTITYHASVYVLFVLNPLAACIPTVLRGTVDIVRYLYITKFPPDCVILTADVVNLYPNIPIDEGCEFVGEAIDEFNDNLPLDNDPIDKVFVLLLLKWVLTNNYVVFNNECYLQIYGTAMGTPVAVVYANIYLYVLEKKAFAIMRTKYPCYNDLLSERLLYVRYIDDIFCVCTSVLFAERLIAVINSISPSIKLTHSIGDSGVFLDVTISKGLNFDKFGVFDVTLYQKPMNAYLYIPVFSYHKRSVYKAYIQAEIRRYTMFCTNEDDLWSIVALFKTRLLDRGYPEVLVDEIMRVKYVRFDELFPTEVQAAYWKQSNLPLPRCCRDYVFGPPVVVKESERKASFVFCMENSPRYSEDVLKDLLNFGCESDEGSYGYVMYKNFCDVVSNKRKHPIICLKSPANMRKLLIRSKYVYPQK